MEPIDFRELTKDDIARFEQKVSKRPGGCWIWRGTRFKNGYGQFSLKKRTILAHRVSWTIHRGKIPKGMRVLHDCPRGDNPRCVNPDHLWLGTTKQNAEDMLAKGRHVKHVPKSEDSPNAKVTIRKVIQIRKMRAKGASYRMIEERFKISHAAAWDICNRKTWKEVMPIGGMDTGLYYLHLARKR